MDGLDGLEVEEYVLYDLGGEVKEVWGVVRMWYRLRCGVRHGAGGGGSGRKVIVDFRNLLHF